MICKRRVLINPFKKKSYLLKILLVYSKIFEMVPERQKHLHINGGFFILDDAPINPELPFISHSQNTSSIELQVPVFFDEIPAIAFSYVLQSCRVQ